MAKTLKVLSEAQSVTPKVGDKTTIINASSGNIFITDEATDTALNSLPYLEKMAVLNSLYSLTPGASKSLSTANGAVNVSFAMGFGQSAVLLVENNS